MFFGDTEQQRSITRTKHTSCFFLFFWGTVDVTQNAGIGYFLQKQVRQILHRTHCFSYFGKRGEEDMKLGRTEMSQGGLGVTDRKALSSYFLANVCAVDVNMCKVFFWGKDSFSAFLEVGSQRKCCERANLHCWLKAP